MVLVVRGMVSRGPLVQQLLHACSWYRVDLARVTIATQDCCNHWEVVDASSWEQHVLGVDGDAIDGVRVELTPLIQ